MSEIAQRDVFRMPAAPALPTVAVERLPRGEFGVDELDADPFWRLVAAFLVECRRAQTRRAYFTDLKAWCAARDLHPLQARRHDVALWARHLAEQLRHTTTGKAVATISVACSRRDRDADPVYVELVLWETQAELAAFHLVKGQQIAFSGRLDPRSWTGRDGAERVALEVHGVELEYGAKPRNGGQATTAEPAAD